MKEIMTIQQLNFIVSNEDKSEVYQQQLREIIMFFAKNTIYQLLESQINFDAMELMSYYQRGDYSQFLFDKTELLIEDFSKISDRHENIKEAFTLVASKMTEIVTDLNSE